MRDRAEPCGPSADPLPPNVNVDGPCDGPFAGPTCSRSTPPSERNQSCTTLTCCAWKPHPGPTLTLGGRGGRGGSTSQVELAVIDVTASLSTCKWCNNCSFHRQDHPGNQHPLLWRIVFACLSAPSCEARIWQGPRGSRHHWAWQCLGQGYLPACIFVNGIA